MGSLNRTFFGSKCHYERSSLLARKGIASGFALLRNSLVIASRFWAKQSFSLLAGIASLAKNTCFVMTGFLLNEKRQALWSYSQ